MFCVWASLNAHLNRTAALVTPQAAVKHENSQEEEHHTASANLGQLHQIKPPHKLCRQRANKSRRDQRKQQQLGSAVEEGDRVERKGDNRVERVGRQQARIADPEGKALYNTRNEMSTAMAARQPSTKRSAIKPLNVPEKNTAAPKLNRP